MSSSDDSFPASLVRDRPGKPRATGMTWVSLFGEGPRQIEDFLQVAGPFVDRAKLGYGWSLLTDEATLRTMTRLCAEASVDVYPGGTLAEMAIRAGRFDELLDWCKRVGFTGFEICDGVIELPDDDRARCIARAREAGFWVTTVVQEVIRKPVVEVVPLAERIRRIKADLAAGATHAHVVFQAMARGETPSDVVGPIKRDQMKAIVDAVGLDKLVWEAQTPDTQLYYLRQLGPEVSLGHMPIAAVAQLEAHRCGLGYESFWSAVWGRPHWS